MKLSLLYSDDESVFPPIPFNDGFNVVFARVKEPESKQHDSHNLGKTFLVSVIDFCLLSTIDKDHPFKTEKAFADFAFFLEIRNADGLFITVRRQVRGRNTVSLQTNSTGKSDYSGLEPDAWEFPNLSITKALAKLNELLRLDSLNGYDYRKGLGYVLRRQSDYDDVFRLERFSRGKDIDWKPFVAMLLGFDGELVRSKYELDGEIKELERVKSRLEEQAELRAEEIDKLKGLIEVREQDTDRLRSQVDAFSFQDIEEDISQTTVVDLEGQIADLNRDKYLAQSRLAEIERSLTTRFEFDPGRIRDLFSEMQVLLPDALLKGYEDLVEFNRRLTSGRTTRLTQLQRDLQQEVASLTAHLKQLDEERSQAMAILRERETLQKFKKLQVRLREEEDQILRLRERLSKLDSVARIDADIEELDQDRRKVTQGLLEAIRKGNSLYREIRKYFSSSFSRIVDAYAIMSVVSNKEGNPEFQVQTVDRQRGDRQTGEGRGFSYKKLLCVCFDLSLVVNYMPKRFYRFLYHDGVFEALDNRKKVALLEVIREACNRDGIQYILTVIDSDLPRDERDSKLLFSSDEVVRELHDQGDSGRLFRMSKF